MGTEQRSWCGEWVEYLMAVNLTPSCTLRLSVDALERASLKPKIPRNQRMPPEREQTSKGRGKWLLELPSGIGTHIRSLWVSLQRTIKGCDPYSPPMAGVQSGSQSPSRSNVCDALFDELKHLFNLRKICEKNILVL